MGSVGSDECIDDLTSSQQCAAVVNLPKGQVWKASGIRKISFKSGFTGPSFVSPMPLDTSVRFLPGRLAGPGSTRF